MNLEEIEKKACRTLALISLIKKSNEKAKVIISSSYYPLFGLANEQSEMVSFQNRVTQRLTKYLERTLTA